VKKSMKTAQGVIEKRLISGLFWLGKEALSTF